MDAFVGGPGGTDALNVAHGANSVVGGGTSNQACDDWSVIAGGYANIVSNSAGGGGEYDGFIGGGEYNTVTGSDLDSAIVGGKENTVSKGESAIVAGEANSVAALGALIGSGNTNAINPGAGYSAIVSGLQNTVSGEYGFIGAGLNNTVSGQGGYVAAGGYNTVSGEGAVIDGGFNSTASGIFATIPGGYVNSAGGTYSFAAGARASAAQTGTFVWSDGSDGDAILTSSRAYQFLARASGGVTFWTNAASTVGAQLAPGSGTWASASDRNLKTDVARIDDDAVLDKVAALPIERWSYKSERGVRHVGPMAQDFYAAFGVGEDDRHITSIDEDGVALAAIKALHGKIADAHAAIGALRLQNARLTALTATQSAQIATLSAEVASIRATMRARR
ncbi:MAG TPA: tail fiber domain-containing protein [Candidatus Elarobacter sp.]|jgi:hypothetical protein|nr:tail fiber domain-containing protein [Candidatus Elarobacter sp.]